MLRIVFALVLMGSFGAVQATLITTWAEFNSNVGTTITDDYSSYTPGIYTDSEMSAIFGETTYHSITFSNQNQVGDLSIRGGNSEYCSGCNGNFNLGFENTSLSTNGGISAVGLDVILHTSRRVSIGDDDPTNPTFSGTIEIEFVDNSIIEAIIPPDIGYYDNNSYFFGFISDVGIRSLTIGTEPSASRHIWVIDNLTIAASAIPEPSTLALMGLGLLGLFGVSRKRK